MQKHHRKSSGKLLRFESGDQDEGGESMPCRTEAFELSPLMETEEGDRLNPNSEFQRETFVSGLSEIHVRVGRSSDATSLRMRMVCGGCNS